MNRRHRGDLCPEDVGRHQEWIPLKDEEHCPVGDDGREIRQPFFPTQTRDRELGGGLDRDDILVVV